MTGGWGIILGSGGIAVVLSAIVALIGTFRSLHANKPIVESTADQQQAAANSTNVTTQQGVINTLSAQLDRQETRIAALEQRLTEREQQNTELRLRVDTLEKAEDVNDQKLRETRTALWETWQYVKRQHSYLTDEERLELGPLPDVERFLK